MSTTAAPRRAQQHPSSPPERTTGKEAAALLRRAPADAKRLLRRFGVPVTEFSERDWLVRTADLRRFLDDAEQRAREQVEQADLQADYIKPAKGRRVRR